jgi:hypothetical protein
MSKRDDRHERVEQLRNLRQRLEGRLGLSNRFRDELIGIQIAKVEAEIARVEGRSRRKTQPHHRPGDRNRGPDGALESQEFRR